MVAAFIALCGLLFWWFVLGAVVLVFSGCFGWSMVLAVVCMVILAGGFVTYCGFGLNVSGLILGFILWSG